MLEHSQLMHGLQISHSDTFSWREDYSNTANPMLNYVRFISWRQTEASQPHTWHCRLAYICPATAALLFFACLSKYLFAEQLFFLTFLSSFWFSILAPINRFWQRLFKLTHTKASLHKALFFVVQADSMPEMPPETVTEEQYTDEHGHTVVKKVLSVAPLATFLMSKIHSHGKIVRVEHGRNKNFSLWEIAMCEELVWLTRSFSVTVNNKNKRKNGFVKSFVTKLYFLLQVTRKIIRRYVSPDGTEKEEVVMQGVPQKPVAIEEGDGYSKVVKRVVLKSDSEHSEVRSHAFLMMIQSSINAPCLH